MTHDDGYTDWQRRYVEHDFPPGTRRTVLHGEDARKSGRDLLMWATDTDDYEDAMSVLRGRPPKDASPTQTIKTAMPVRLVQDIRDIAQALNVPMAQVVRWGTAEYVDRMRKEHSAPPGELVDA